MKLIQIYQCLCDETRLRILNLLSSTPLCVCHLQEVLQMTQVKMSKHLNYMKKRGMVESVRYENKMLYFLPKKVSPALDKNLRCLQDCSKEQPLFKEDLLRLKEILAQVETVKDNISLTNTIHEYLW